MRPYACAMGLVHLFLGETRNDNRGWVPNFGTIPIYVVTHDYMAMEKTVSRAPVGLTPPIPSQRLKPEKILEKMQSLDGLSNVNTTRANATGIKYQRKACDVCVIKLTPCKPTDDLKLCLTCRDQMGLPCCTWTDGVSNQNESKTTPEIKRITRHIGRLLCFADDIRVPSTTHDPAFEDIFLAEDIAREGFLEDAVVRFEQMNKDADEKARKEEEIGMN